MTEPKQSVRKAHCAECGGVRNCDVRGQHQKTDEAADGLVQFWTNIYILQCRGCDSLFVQKTESNSEDLNHEYSPDGSEFITTNKTITYWPSISNRKKPDWFSDFRYKIDDSEHLFDSMSEFYGALDAGLPRLAVIGIRTCFDIASAMLKVAEHLSFEAKIIELVSLGKLTDLDKGRLNLLVEAGNASAHRGWNPRPDEIKLLAEILEHFIENAFILPMRTSRLDADAAKLKTKVPARKKKTK